MLRHAPPARKKLALLLLVAGAQVAADGLLHARGHLQRERLARDLRRALVGAEEGDALAAVAEVVLEHAPLFLGEGSIEKVEAEINELLAIDQTPAPKSSRLRQRRELAQ